MRYEVRGIVYPVGIIILWGLSILGNNIQSLPLLNTIFTVLAWSFPPVSCAVSLIEVNLN